jgi:aminoglycoside phosphotransferase
MIDQIKKIILENKDKFGLADFSANQIKISKFFHGSPLTSTKILFFVSADDKPACLIKMARDVGSNDKLEREIEGLKYFLSLGLNVPKLFFIGEINNLKYICQQIISGHPVGKKDEEKIFPFVAGYHNSVKKIKKIKIADILDDIKDLDIKNDKEYEQVIDLLNQRKDNQIFIAKQHGDLTYKNLMNNQNKIVFIDFENFGLRSFWGNDVIHYLARMTDVFNKIYSKNNNVLETMNGFVQMTRKFRDEYRLGISSSECEDLFLMDLLFEDLQRTYSPLKKEIIPIMKNLWLK